MALESSIAALCEKSKPYLAVIMLQFGYSGMSIISKVALDRGMNIHTLVVYRHLIAFFVIAPFALIIERKIRPKMTWSIFFKIALMGLLEPTIDQNLYYTGMKLTTATFTAAMCNILPAFAFILAWIFKLERVNIRKIPSQAKILGTIITVGGAMIMTLIKGSILNLPWTNPEMSTHATSTGQQNPVLGAAMIVSGCLCWAGFVILQANTLKTYPTELSLTALICLMGAIEGSVFAFIKEFKHPSVWTVHLDLSLLAAVYSGVICSGVAYYVQGVIMKSKGPVFVTAFNPLSMVIVAILSSFVLSEVMYLGRVIGAVVIVTGLYMVLWGKSKDLPRSDSVLAITPSSDEHLHEHQMNKTNHQVGLNAV